MHLHVHKYSGFSRHAELNILFEPFPHEKEYSTLTYIFYMQLGAYSDHCSIKQPVWLNPFSLALLQNCNHVAPIVHRVLAPLFQLLHKTFVLA